MLNRISRLGSEIMLERSLIAFEAMVFVSKREQIEKDYRDEEIDNLKQFERDILGIY